MSLPTSRRTGSKQESRTASGVSSIMRLTPVTDSKARMLRPSRPMILPFISSPGRCSTDTTDSLVCSLATRWIARVTIRRARVSPSRRAWLSVSLTMSAASRLAWFSMLATSSAFAWSAVSPAARSSTSRRWSSSRASSSRWPSSSRPACSRAAERCSSVCCSESSQALPVGQPVLTALKVGPQPAGLVLGRPEIGLGLGAGLGDPLGRLLGAAHDPGGVGFSGRPDLLGRPAGFVEPLPGLGCPGGFARWMLYPRRDLGGGGASGLSVGVRGGDGRRARSG